MGAALVAFLKRLALQAVIDEETRENLVMIVIAILVSVVIIVVTLGSLPSILINTFVQNMSQDINVLEDKAKVAVYQDTIFIVDELNKEWIEAMRSEYDYCDEFEIIYNYSLTWQDLIAIDSVLLKQDFSNMNQRKIINVALKFLVRTVTVEEFEVEEDVGHNRYCDDDCDEEHIRLVTKKIAIIRIDTRNFEDVLPEVGIVDEEDTLLALNIYSMISNIDIEGNLNIYDDIDLTDLQEYPEGHANLPYYNQTDARWGNNSYGNTTILDGGCGPTSLAMVVSGLTGQRITPDIVADWSYRNGHRAEGSGSYWSLMTKGGKNYGLNVEAVSRKDPNSIIKALSEGYPVVVSMGKGHFTSGGHFIVLRGITADGKILVHDSASVERSNKEWDLSIIMNESSTNGGTSGSPFWIFRP
ncbi:hypothetical protein CIW83_03010 [Tissierella sp. P1]|uniref:C39 family peptidase n=1 Tax=Tissierella sp. P1 TaxID=1280483 RepID=UPI000BA12BDB|nr:C39 family peptidase [Tissierella sp. P1]OZV13530.1 hypothetical protein CIW83_03010 [Tissierella sp. P1]